MTATKQLEAGLAAGMDQVVTLFFKEASRDMFPSQSPFSHNLLVGSVESRQRPQRRLRRFAHFTHSNPKP